MSLVNQYYLELWTNCCYYSQTKSSTSVIANILKTNHFTQQIQVIYFKIVKHQNSYPDSEVNVLHTHALRHGHRSKDYCSIVPFFTVKPVAQLSNIIHIHLKIICYNNVSVNGLSYFQRQNLLWLYVPFLMRHHVYQK